MADRDAIGRGAKGLLIAVGLIIGLVAAEGALRLRYQRLPSLAPLDDAALQLKPFQWDHQLGGNTRGIACYERIFLVQPPEVRQRAAHLDTFTLWVSGDSVASGVGAQSGMGMADVIRAEVARGVKTPVSLLTLGVRGGDYCSSLSGPMHEIKAGHRPDAVVVQLFADDFEKRAALISGERLVMLPGMVKHPVGRALVSYTYTGNLVWYFLRPEAHVGLVRTIDREGRQTFQRLVRDFLELMDEYDVAVTIALVGPTGLPFCPDDPPERSRCRWLGQDMDLMASLLTNMDVDFVDLRDLWRTDPDLRASVETTELWQTRHGMAIHPNDEGHRLLGQAIAPAVLESIPPDWRSLKRTVPVAQE